MHQIFEQWQGNLIPVDIKDELDKNGKKICYPNKWKNGETYSEFNKNSIGLRTGKHTANVVDVDTQDLDLLDEPWKSWVQDRLLFEDTLIVKSKNGYHFYFYCDFEIGSAIKKTPYIDFRGEGGLIYIHSTSASANYEVICDEEPTTDIEEIKHLLPEYKAITKTQVEDDEVGFNNLDDETDTSVLKAGRKTLAEIEELLNLTSSDVDRDTWLQIMASAYNMIDTNPERLESVFKTWSEKSDAYTDEGFNIAWKEISSGRFGKSFKGGLLYLEANSERLKTLTSKIEAIENDEDVDELISEIKELPSLKTKQKEDTDVRAELAEKINVKTKSSKTLKTKQVRTLVKELTPVKETVAPEGDFEVFRLNNKYLTRVGRVVSEDIGSQMLTEHLASSGISFAKDELGKFKRTVKTISRFRKTADYTLKSQMEFTLKSRRGTTFSDEYVCHFNPLADVEIGDIDEDIVNDFFNEIWNGKAYDIVKLVGLTIRFKETKLNRLMLIAPSNSGKSELFHMLNFQKIHMARLLLGLRGEKGVGKTVIDGLKESELLLIDEANKALEQDIKDLDKEIQLDQFGSGGTQVIPLKFTALTSTHSSATRNNSDELYNRFLQVELTRKEMKHTVTESKLFRRDAEAYSKSITNKLIELFLDALHGEYTQNDLAQLQSKYRLPLNNDLNELLFGISEDFIEETKTLARDVHGDIVKRGDKYYYKRKGDITNFFMDKLGEIASLDSGKYAEMLTNHFFEGTRESVKLDGKVVKYYPISLNKFYPDGEEMVTEMFDELDEDEFK